MKSVTHLLDEYINLTRSYNWSYTIDACNATNTAYSKLTPVVG